MAPGLQSKLIYDVGDVAGGQPALLRAVGLHEQGERLGHTDRIRQLHQGTLAQAALHHRLRHLPAHVGRGTVHLGGVLPGEGSTAVRAPSPISIYDYFSPSEASVTLGAADDDFPDGLMCRLVCAPYRVTAGFPFLSVISSKHFTITSLTMSSFMRAMLGAVASAPV